MVKAKAGIRLDAEGFALLQCVGDRGIHNLFPLLSLLFIYLLRLLAASHTEKHNASSIYRHIKVF